MFSDAAYIFIAGGKVIGIFPVGEKHTLSFLHPILSAGVNHESRHKGVVNGKGCIAIPGFIDIHVHVTGGGGELSIINQSTLIH